MSIFSDIGKAVGSAIKTTGQAIETIVSTVGSTTATVSSTKAATSANITLVRAFADVINGYDTSTAYMNKAVQCASYVKRPVKVGTTSTKGLRTVVFGSNSLPTIFVTKPVDTTTAVSTSGAASQARNNLFNFMNSVSGFVSRAKGAGYSPPSNPFVEIVRLNSLRTKPSADIVVSEKEATDLLYNIRVYVDLLQAEAAGAIDLTTGTVNVAQLEHVSLAYTGLGTSGNAAADLLTLLPNADEIKKQKADAALAVLNFSKRVPHVIFTADYLPNQDDGSQGVMIGWKSMADASGFIVKRHGVMGNTDTSFDVPSAQVVKNNSAFMDYAKTYVLTFYDQIKPETVSLFLDVKPPPDDYYIYDVQAYQNAMASTTSLIPSSYIAMHLTNQQVLAINNRMVELDPSGYKFNGASGNIVVSSVTISPWPVIAEQLFGDDTLDWVLAATNIQASIDRADPIADTREYSYLNANLEFLLKQAGAGKLVKPQNVDDIRGSIASAISTYGITQTMEALLQETGILYYFDGVDANSSNVFERAGTLDVTNSGVIGTVAAAIDPENATIDLKLLASNLAAILGSKQALASNTYIGTPSSAGAKPGEIDITDPDLTSQTSSESGIEFIAELGVSSDPTVDLTTFDGLAQMVRVIRVMSDFSANRAPATDDSKKHRETSGDNTTTTPTTTTTQKKGREKKGRENGKVATAAQAQAAGKSALAALLGKVTTGGQGGGDGD